MDTIGRLKHPGIYAIKNVLNDKCYIGSTIDLYRRRCEHISQLRNNKHKNRHLQFSWNKNGEDVFVFEVLEVIDDYDQLQTTEQRYLDDCVNKYNIREIAESNRGMKLSPRTEEQRKRMSEQRKGKTSSFKGKKHTEESLRKNRESHTGKKQSQETIDKRVAKNTGKKRTKEMIQKTADGKSKLWYLISPDGNCVDVKNLKNFCRENGLNQGNMMHMYQGKYNHCKGWKKQILEEI